MKVCKQIVKRIEETVFETVERWIEQVVEICEDLPWPLDWFCKAVTTLIKIVETVVKTVVTVIVTVVCYPVAFTLALAGQLVNLALTIPILGTLLKWWIGALVWIGSQAAGWMDAGLGLIGIRPIKHLRLEIIILMRPDRTLTVPQNRVDLTVQRTEQIFRSRADVKVHTNVRSVTTPSVTGALHVDTGVGLLGEDLTEAGMYFQSTIRDLLWEDSFLFAIRVGAPIVAFIVDGVGESPMGCSSGPLADYVCVEGGRMIVPPQLNPVVPPLSSQPANAGPEQAATTLAHEMAHACGLAHDNILNESSGDPTNLMYAKNSRPDDTPRGDNLSPFQRAIVRSSPHVTYL